MAGLLISIHSFEVLASDSGIFTMLGYHPCQINGQNVLILMGESSDARMFQRAILNMEGFKMQLVLYDSTSRKRLFIASCSPFHEACGFVGCLLTLQPSEAITLRDVCFDDKHACALVSANAPNCIHTTNDFFLHRFACARPNGLPLHLFYSGPDFSFRDFAHAANTDSAWSALLNEALGGRITRMSPFLPDAENSLANAEEVTCVPVAEAHNGRISHLLVTFGPMPCSRGETKSLPNANAHASPAARRLTKVPTAADATGFFICPHLHSHGPAIFPRPKPLSDGTLGSVAPVVITRELVAGLADRPLQQAAAAAGVSATAFKKACRKLGVRRWVYSRRRRPEPQGTIPNACADVGGAADMDCCTDFDEGRGPGSSPGEPETGLSPGDVWSAEGAGLWHSPSAADAAAHDSTAWCVSMDTDSECYGRGLGSAWGPFLEGPVVDDALVRDMLGASWPLQA